MNVSRSSLSTQIESNSESQTSTLLDKHKIDAIHQIGHLSSFQSTNFEWAYKTLKNSNFFDLLNNPPETNAPLGSNNLSINILASIYGEDKQTEYSRLMHASIKIMTKLKKEHHLHFYQTLYLFSSLRQYIAQKLEYKTLLIYGQPRSERTDVMSTLLVGVYEILTTKIKKYLPKNEPLISPHSPYSEIKIPCKAFDHQNNEYVLSTYVYHFYHHYILHSPFKNIAPGLKYVDYLHEQALNSTDPTEIFYLTGKIFWWLCQLKPFEAGDPSIAEMFIRTIWEEKKIENVSWKEDVIPWIEVMAEFDVEKFAKEFHTLFVRPEN